MEALINRCTTYLSDTLGVDAVFSRYAKTGKLPYFLQDQYVFYRLRLLATPFVVMAMETGEAQTPARIREHARLVGEKTGETAILLFAGMTSFDRKRLIASKVPFIVPGNQLYLPDLGLDLREHFIKTRAMPAVFPPVAQIVVIYALVRPKVDGFTPGQLAKALGYSRMSISRAIQAIVSAGLANKTINGRQGELRFGRDRRRLWKKALPFLKTPVRERVWVKGFKRKQALSEAGETALAGYSMLAAPRLPVCAMAAGHWKTLNQKGAVEVCPYPDEAVCQMEVWRYDPSLFAAVGRVDPFSLYLSLRETQDERVEAALDEMMEAVQW